jgi:hypothetical protein
LLQFVTTKAVKASSSFSSKKVQKSALVCHETNKNLQQFIVEAVAETCSSLLGEASFISSSLSNISSLL